MKPERWHDATKKIFPHQVGFTAPGGLGSGEETAISSNITPDCALSSKMFRTLGLARCGPKPRPKASRQGCVV